MQTIQIIVVCIVGLLLLCKAFGSEEKPHKAPWFDGLDNLQYELFLNLHQLPNDSLIKSAILAGLNKGTEAGFREAIDYIHSQGFDNPEVMIEEVGAEIWNAVTQLKRMEISLMQQHFELN